jgi:tetratricopeptide (TPR) repeat protein
VFREYGIDVEALPAEEAAARIAASHIKLDLVLSLDRWATSLRFDARKLDPKRWQRLLAISRAADPDPWRLRYIAATEAGDLPALRELAKQADLNRMRSRILADLGDSLRVAGDPEAAVSFLRKVQKRHPADYTVNSCLAWAFRSLKPPQWDEAIVFRRIAVAVRPQSSLANFYLGFSLQMVGKLDDAIDYYRAAVELDPEQASAQFSLAHALSIRGQPEEALVRFRKARDLLPNDPFPLNGLAWELATGSEPKLRDPARAVLLAKEVIELSRKQGDRPERLGDYWNTLGVAQYRAGNLGEAQAALQKSLDLDDGQGSHYVYEDWFFLAMVNWKLGKKDEARQWYNRAVQWMQKSDPKNEQLRRFRAEVEELMREEKKE